MIQDPQEDEDGAANENESYLGQTVAGSSNNSPLYNVVFLMPQLVISYFNRSWSNSSDLMGKAKVKRSALRLCLWIQPWCQTATAPDGKDRNGYRNLHRATHLYVLSGCFADLRHICPLVVCFTGQEVIELL